MLVAAGRGIRAMSALLVRPILSAAEVYCVRVLNSSVCIVQLRRIPESVPGNLCHTKLPVTQNDSAPEEYFGRTPLKKRRKHGLPFRLNPRVAE